MMLDLVTRRDCPGADKRATHAKVQHSELWFQFCIWQDYVAQYLWHPLQSQTYDSNELKSCCRQLRSAHCVSLVVQSNVLQSHRVVFATNQCNES